MYIREGSANTLPNLQQNAGSPSSWDPSTISNIVFGIIMVFVGITAIWQGRHRRVVALDEELVIIRPVHRSTSSSNHPLIQPGPPIQVPAPYHMLHDPLNVSSSTAQHAIMGGERNQHGLPISDDNAVISTISNRVLTLSTIGSAEINNERLSLEITTAELGMPEAECSANLTDGFAHQDTDLDNAT